jgi:hypothetical protein
MKTTAFPSAKPCACGRAWAALVRRPGRQIAVMHRIIVEEKKWIGETASAGAELHLTARPERQLATYIGWLMHKTKGGLFAGTLFVLPGLIAIMCSRGSTCCWARSRSCRACSSA